jgi:endonuclease III related protein
MSASSSARIARIIRVLDTKYGKIDWWRGTPDEVMIGAILTQQTRWENVKKALMELKRRGLCSLRAIGEMDSMTIESAIRCTGFYHIKAQRLKSLASQVNGVYGDTNIMEEKPTHQLRECLLRVHGIGAETADSILCYGFQRPCFVIDAYTERICGCIGITEKRQALKTVFEKVLPGDAAVHQQVHAHIVEYAKEFCAKNRCDECTLANLNG